MWGIAQEIRNAVYAFRLLAARTFVDHDALSGCQQSGHSSRFKGSTYALLRISANTEAHGDLCLVRLGFRCKKWLGVADS